MVEYWFVQMFLLDTFKNYFEQLTQCDTLQKQLGGNTYMYSTWIQTPQGNIPRTRSYYHFFKYSIASHNTIIVYEFHCSTLITGLLFCFTININIDIFVPYYDEFTEIHMVVGDFPSPVDSYGCGDFPPPQKVTPLSSEFPWLNIDICYHDSSNNKYMFPSSTISFLEPQIPPEATSELFSSYNKKNPI